MDLCKVCPNGCNVDRRLTAGACGVTEKIKIAKYYLHPFEEPVISCKNGSGTVFFSGCSLRCAFCQNFEVSHGCRGKEISVEELAKIFRELYQMGADNINLVNPTHYSREIIKALEIFRPNIPIVWNTHGYETLENLQLIDPYVDIYLTDLKYFAPQRSLRYAKKANYFEVAKKATEFMLKSKSPVLVAGKMTKGVIVRHLILPTNTDESCKILEFLAPLLKDNYLSLMSQYTPFGNLDRLEEINRKITPREYKKVLNKLYDLDVKNVFLQDTSSADTAFIPEWDY